MATSEEPISLVMSVVQRLAQGSELLARGLRCCPQFPSDFSRSLIQFPEAIPQGLCCPSPRVDSASPQVAG